MFGYGTFAEITFAQGPTEQEAAIVAAVGSGQGSQTVNAVIDHDGVGAAAGGRRGRVIHDDRSEKNRRDFLRAKAGYDSAQAAKKARERKDDDERERKDKRKPEVVTVLHRHEPVPLKDDLSSTVSLAAVRAKIAADERSRKIADAIAAIEAEQLAEADMNLRLLLLLAA